MYPWFWQWSPQYHFPWSGSVAQRIEPRTFFDAIQPSAGNSEVEWRAFNESSYGTQLGQIARVLLELSADVPLSARAAEARASLQALQDKIAGFRDESRASRVSAAQAALHELEQNDPAALQALLQDWVATHQPASGTAG